MQFISIIQWRQRHCDERVPALLASQHQPHHLCVTHRQGEHCAQVCWQVYIFFVPIRVWYQHTITHAQTLTHTQSHTHKLIEILINILIRFCWLKVYFHTTATCYQLWIQFLTKNSIIFKLQLENLKLCWCLLKAWFPDCCHGRYQLLYKCPAYRTTSRWRQAPEFLWPRPLLGQCWCSRDCWWLRRVCLTPGIWWQGDSSLLSGSPCTR